MPTRHPWTTKKQKYAWMKGSKNPNARKAFKFNSPPQGGPLAS